MAKIYCYRPAIIAFFEDPISEKGYIFIPIRLLKYYYSTVTVAMDIPSNIPLVSGGVFAEEQNHLTKGNMLTDGTGVIQWTCVMDLVQ